MATKFDVDVAVAAPEPTSVVLLGLGSLAMIGCGLRRARRNK